MPASIRRATPNDLDALVALEEAVFAGDRLSRRSFHRLVASPTADLLVAELTGAVAGYCLVLYRSASAAARLYSLARSSQHAEAGTGRLLLEAAEAAARQRGCVVLRLEVREDNLRAIGLYERSGFSSLGRRPGYYEDGAAALRYEKFLGDDASPAAIILGERMPS